MQCIGAYVIACKFIQRRIIMYLDVSPTKFRMYKVLFFSSKFHTSKRAFDIIIINMSIKYNIVRLLTKYD